MKIIGREPKLITKCSDLLYNKILDVEEFRKSKSLKENDFRFFLA